MTAPYNKLIVTVGSKFVDEISLPGGKKIYKYVNLAREEHASLLATVVSVPNCIKKTFGYEEVYVPEIKAGDTIMMRYDVIFNYREQPDRTNPIYKNELFFRGRSYWFCDVLQLFGVKRGKSWDMANGYAMLEIVEETEKQTGLIINPFAVKKQKHKARLTSIGNTSLKCKTGDIVYFLPQFVQTYSIDNKEFYLIPEKYIYGYDRS